MPITTAPPAQRTEPTSQSGEIAATGSIRKSVIGGLLFLIGLFSYLFAAFIYLYLHPNNVTPSKTVLLPFLLIPFTALALVVRCLLIIPLRVTIDGGSITTRGFAGTKSIALSAIAEVKTALLLPSRNGRGIYGIRIRGTSGVSTMIELGALPRAVRRQCCQLLYPALSSYMSDDRDLARIWKRWAEPALQVSIYSRKK